MVFLGMVLLTVVVVVLFFTLQVWAVFWGSKRLGVIKSQLIAFAAPLLVPLILAGYFFVASVDVEYNPMVKNKNDLVGAWVDANYRISLHGDGTCTISGKDLNANGTWRLADFNMTLTNSPYEYLRVIQVAGVYQLLKSTKDKDPDEWDERDVLVRE